MVAILLQTAIALPLALSGTFTQLAVLSAVARLATYFGTAAAVPVLRRKFPNRPGVVRLPGGWLIPGLALVLCVVFASSAEARNLIAGAVAIAVGFLLYLLRRPPLPAHSAPTEPAP